MKAPRVFVLSAFLAAICLTVTGGCASVDRHEHPAAQAGSPADQDAQSTPRQRQVLALQGQSDSQHREIAALQELLKEQQRLTYRLETQIQEIKGKLKKLEQEVQALRILNSAQVKAEAGFLKIPLATEVQASLQIKPASALPFISFEIEDPNIATVEPRSPSTVSQVLRIRGIKQGQTRLLAKANGRLCTKVNIEVRRPGFFAKLRAAPSGGLETLLLMIICGVGYLVAYHTYGRFLARKIFKLNPGVPVPSKELNDGIDYVPTRKGIIFGHHYTSIAGTGPIVGPAIGIIWGWLPAILWVLLGNIFMGAVHDLGTLVVSMRNEGKSLSEAAAKYINARVRFIFFAIVFLSLLLVIAVFGVVIAAVFTRFPSAVIPVWLQIPIAVALGFAVYKKNANVVTATAVAVAGMYLCIAIGSRLPVELSTVFGMPSTGLWVIILLIYAWVASTLPVTTLLQPRDYINAWQLFIAMALLAAGATIASISGDLPLVAPAVNTSLPAGTPPVWPFMFVVIACGAISGFHSLVASGTTAKQVAKEPDALFVGYGSMLLEGALAVLVIICVAAGIGMALKLGDGSTLSGHTAWQYQYGSWMGAKGLTDKIAPVVMGAANMMKTLGLPQMVGITLMGVFIASFAGTTLDTSVRIQRYVVGELANDLKIPYLANRWVGTTFAVLTAAGLAFTTGADGKGAMTLWPLFGSANQLLASLALLIVTLYLKRKGGMKFLFTALPCLAMLTITSCAMIENQKVFIKNGDWLLAIIGGGVFLLALWMIIEGVIVLFKGAKAEPAQQKQP